MDKDITLQDWLKYYQQSWVLCRTPKMGRMRPFFVEGLKEDGNLHGKMVTSGLLVREAFFNCKKDEWWNQFTYPSLRSGFVNIPECAVYLDYRPIREAFRGWSLKRTKKTFITGGFPHSYVNKSPPNYSFLTSDLLIIYNSLVKDNKRFSTVKEAIAEIDSLERISSAVASTVCLSAMKGITDKHVVIYRGELCGTIKGTLLTLDKTFEVAKEAITRAINDTSISVQVA